MTPQATAPARRPVGEDEVARAFAAVDEGHGFYFGTDSGVADLHPLGATLVAEPLLRFVVHADGLTVQPVPSATLRVDPGRRAWTGLAPWMTAGRRFGAPLALLRGFLGAFAPESGARLLGALRFEAHHALQRGARAPAGEAALGFFVFAATWFERAADGAWTRVEIGGTAQALGAPDDARADAPPTFAAAAARAPGPAAPPGDDHAPGEYAALVARAADRLRAGPLVSLTLSQSFRRPIAADLSAAAAFARLRAHNPAPATFCFASPQGERVFGASPDLQLVVRGRRVDALPVCGTVARGRGPLDEADAWRELHGHAVDAATLAVCTDALRNDLAPLCVPGSLRLEARRRPLALATVVHTVDHLRGELRAGVDAWDAIAATAAPPMLVGTPRAHALDAIAALEASPRGWYGGLVVDIDAAGHARVGTLLRAAVLRDGVAEVRTGGDLLPDSNPAREEAESRHKAVSLWRALRLDDAASGGGDAPASARPGSRDVLPLRARLHAGDDAFAESLVERLAGHGVEWHAERDGGRGAADAGSAALPLDVWLDPLGLAEAGEGRVCLAIGDAALALVARAGGSVVATDARRGRALRAVEAEVPAGTAPVPATAWVGLYLRGAIAADGAPPGWRVAWRSVDGEPLLLVAAPAAGKGTRIACLPRPESSLTEVAFVASLLAQVRRALRPADRGAADGDEAIRTAK